MSKGVFRVFLLYFSLAFAPAAFAQLSLPADTVVKTKRIRHLVGFPAILHSPELSWAAGGAGSYYFKFDHKDSAIRTSYFQALGIATLRHQLVLAVDGSIFFPNEAYILRVHGSLSRFPDRFWGIGNNTVHTNQEPYTISQYYLFPQLLRQVYRKFYVGIAYESQNVFSFQHGDSSLLVRQNVAGRDGSFTSGVGMLLLWDSRNNAFSSSRGFYFQYYINEFTHALGSQYHYLSQLLDVRQYFTLSPNQTLALQFVGSFNRGNVPVRSMANIGSSSIMRGYYDGRFTDDNLMAVQGELRQHLYRRFGMVAFAGVGRVAHSFSEFALNGLKLSLGTGLRFAIDRKERLNARLDLGFGHHSNGVYLNLSEAF